MLVSYAAWPQSKVITSGDQQWIQYYNQLKISDSWVILTDGGFRWKDGMGASSQYIARTGIGFKATAEVRFTIGFAHLGFYTADTVSKVEYRPYQEMLIKQKLGPFSATHRFRSEQRFFKNTDGGKTTFNHRFRYRFMAGLIVMQSKSEDIGRRLKLMVGDEIFLNAGSEIVHNIFDHNRVLAGPALQFNKDLTVSLLYDHLFKSTSTVNKYQWNSIIWLGIKHKIDATRKETTNDSL